MINKTNKCPECKGEGGGISITRGNFVRCSMCKGRGLVNLYGPYPKCDKCKTCNGTGTVKPIKKRIEQISLVAGDWRKLERIINKLIDAYNLDK